MTEVKPSQNQGKYYKKGFGTGLEPNLKTRNGFTKYGSTLCGKILKKITRVDNIKYNHRGVTIFASIENSPLVHQVEHFDLWTFDEGPESLLKYLEENEHSRAVKAFQCNPRCIDFYSALSYYSQKDKFPKPDYEYILVSDRREEARARLKSLEQIGAIERVSDDNQVEGRHKSESDEENNNVDPKSDGSRLLRPTRRYRPIPNVTHLFLSEILK